MLERYPFLTAAMDDMQLASDLSSRGIGNARHVVCLLHDAIEFLLYETLLALDEDIYKNGQNTIGLDAALAKARAAGIDVPLVGAIRTIQKHRGDAKHHAQVPHGEAFARMSSEFRILASRLVHEQFGRALGKELGALGLMPYHLALYESYRKYRTHNWSLALRLAMGAVLHKHRATLSRADDYSTASVREPLALLELVSHEIGSQSDSGPAAVALKGLVPLPETLRALLAREDVPGAAEAAGRGYALVDELLPSSFDIRTARQITRRLVQPAALMFERGMGWSKWQLGDTDRKRDLEVLLADLLKNRPDVVTAFGPPHYEDDDDRYWRWWEFAVFDGTRWHTFHMSDSFGLSLESGSLDEESGLRRERVAELILTEFKSVPAAGTRA